MSTCFGCEIQAVYSCLNRTEITENRHQKLKPKRNEKNLNRGSPTAYAAHYVYFLENALYVFFFPCNLTAQYLFVFRVSEVKHNSLSTFRRKLL